MKKIVLLIFTLVLFISISMAATPAQEVLGGVQGSLLSEEQVTGQVNRAGNTVKNVGSNILEQISSWSLPICAILVIWGSVQYFILGIRNLYKKRQGLLLMWGSITFYVITLFASLILSFMTGN